MGGLQVKRGIGCGGDVGHSLAPAPGSTHTHTFLCRSSDLRGKAVYHTNVMMAIGTGVAIVCADSVTDAEERRRLLDALGRTHEVC